MEKHGISLEFIPYVFYSAIFWAGISLFVSPLLSKRFTSTYAKLNYRDKLDWDTRTTSTLHGIVAFSICFYCLGTDNITNDNPVWGYSWPVFFGCSVVIGYLISDLIIIVIFYKYIGLVSYLIHHFVSVFAYACVVLWCAYAWFAKWRMLAEFSTAFVNQRWFFDICGYPRSSKEYMVNGMLMALSFFLVRIATIPFFWMKVWSTYHSQEVTASGWLWYVAVIIPMILDILNLFWMQKIFIGAKKVLKQQSLEKSKAA